MQIDVNKIQGGAIERLDLRLPIICHSESGIASSPFIFLPRWIHGAALSWKKAVAIAVIESADLRGGFCELSKRLLSQRLGFSCMVVISSLGQAQAHRPLLPSHWSRIKFVS